MNKINLLILGSILITLSTFYLTPDFVVEYLAFSGENLMRGRIWTLFTSLFLHADVTHLVGNMIFLFVFGNTMEDEVKFSRTLAVFLIGGATAFVSSVFFYGSQVTMVGSSAAIFTLIAIVMLVKPLRFSFIFLMPLGLVAIIYLVYNLMAVYYNVHGDVAYVSHVLGFVMGLPFGIAWSERLKKNLFIAFLFLILFYLVLYFIPKILN